VTKLGGKIALVTRASRDLRDADGCTLAYNLFRGRPGTEGFDTRDLKDAKVLLDELSS